MDFEEDEFSAYVAVGSSKTKPATAFPSSTEADFDFSPAPAVGFRPIKLNRLDDEFEIIAGNPELPQNTEKNTWLEDLEDIAVSEPKTVVSYLPISSNPSKSAAGNPTETRPSNAQTKSDFGLQITGLLEDASDDSEDDSESLEVLTYETPAQETTPSTIEIRSQNPPTRPPLSFTQESSSKPRSDDTEKPTKSRVTEVLEATQGSLISTSSSQGGFGHKDTSFKVTPPETPALNTSFRRHRFFGGRKSEDSKESVEGKTEESTWSDEKEREVAVELREERPEEWKEERKPRVKVPPLRLESIQMSPIDLPQVTKPPPDAESAPAKPTEIAPDPLPKPIPKALPKPSQTLPSSNPMQPRFQNKLSAMKKPVSIAEERTDSPDKPRRLSNEFEEDAMGEAKEWLAYSANPELNDESSDERDDEFSIKATAGLKLKRGEEKEYRSNEEPASSGPTLDSIAKEKVKETGKKKNKKIDLKTRKMIAEAKMQEEIKAPADPQPVRSSPGLSKPVLKPVFKSDYDSKPVSQEAKTALFPAPQQATVLNPGPQGTVVLNPAFKKPPVSNAVLQQTAVLTKPVLPQPSPAVLSPSLDISPIELVMDGFEDATEPPLNIQGIDQIPSQREDPKEDEFEDQWNKATAAAVQERNRPKEEVKTVCVTYPEIWPVFEAMDLRAHDDPEVETLSPRVEKVSWLKRCFSAEPEELEFNELKEKRKHIFSLLKVQFNESPLHLQVLMSVWKLYTKADGDCPRYGHHWDKLGFQGADPATDLRSMGIFGLLQLLFFASCIPEEAAKILAYSRESGCNFPFAAVSLNISKITIEALREERLNKHINRWNSVFDTVTVT